ncbi:hypothetical protein CH252_32960 [Rhodococcus sp. 06-1477-1B]|nr:hypothetical protein CH252_32960 [Rhodococcus sp. 06-1477-1B]
MARRLRTAAAATTDPAAAIRALPPLDIRAAVAAGADANSAASDAARDHPVARAAWADRAHDGRSAAIIATAQGALAARTAVAHADRAVDPTPF